MTDSTRPGTDRGAVTDAELATAALRGSHTACESLVRRFERPVYNLVFRLVRDPSTAEDLTQDTFMKLFRALGSYDPQQRFSSWLFRIAHNTAIDHLRQRRLLTAEPPPGADAGDTDIVALLPDEKADSPEASAARSELAEALDAAIDRLRPEYRAAVILRHQEDLDYGEIAEVLAVPLGTVKTYLHRARREMAEHLARTGWRARETGSGGAP
jgi:RNA polymerase sigma-70 factor, ECF subfamily